MRDMRTFISGPAYAQRLVRHAHDAGAQILTNAMVTAINLDNSVDVTTPEGLLRVQPGAVIMATGARERPRPARLIPGERPSGVYTTGQLQNIVHLHHSNVGKRAVVVGAELVSWSAVMTLRHAGCSTVAMTTEYPSPESYAAFNVPGKALLRVPVATRTRVVRIIGKPHLRGVEVENLDTGARRVIDCDTVIFTGTGSPTTSWPAVRASKSTPEPWDLSSTPPCAPANRVSSPPETFCIPSTLPTSPPWTAPSSPTASRHT